MSPDALETRRIVLGWRDPDTLIEYQNYLRRRADEPPLPATGDKVELLNRIYPTISFTVDDRKVAAEVRPGVEGTLKDQFGLFDDASLKTTVSGGDFPFGNRCTAAFRPDGIGYLDDGYGFEFFDHALDLAGIKAECEDDLEEIEERLQAYFYEELNVELEDPFFDPGGEGSELHFERGSQEELERLVRLFVLTEPDVEAHAGEEFRIYAAGEEDDPYLESEDGYWSERLDALVTLALEENRPVGWSYDYNDGAYDRRSGYSLSSDCFGFDIDELLEAPARERMAARRELKAWLAGRDRTPEEFEGERAVGR